MVLGYSPAFVVFLPEGKPLFVLFVVAKTEKTSHALLEKPEEKMWSNH